MSLKHTLTNERLTSNPRFGNSFALVNTAIGEARARVHSGEGEENPHIACDVMEDLAYDRCGCVNTQELVLEDTPGDEICFPDDQEVV